MKKLFLLISVSLMLNGCAESIALLGSSVGGASSGKMLQSSLNSAISYGVKQQTGKTPLGHVLTYAEEKNPEKKQETCISFIEKTRSEFCTIVKKQISLTNLAVKEKTLDIIKKYPQNTNKLDKSFMDSFFKIKQSPRDLAVVLQAKIKEKSKIKNLNQYFLKR